MKTLVLLAFLYLTPTPFPFNDATGNDFGEGTVYINAYAYPPGMLLHPIDSAADARLVFYRMVYAIKKDNVFSALQPDSLIRNTKITSSGQGQTIQAKGRPVITRPSYYIDWSDHTVYEISKMVSGKRIVKAVDLREYTYEIFYRAMLDSVKAVIISTSPEKTYVIAGKSCHSGRVKMKTGEECTFYYTTERPAVRSPLNAWFPDDFDDTVMAIAFNADWSSGGKGKMVFRVEKISDGPVPDSTVNLPSNVEIIRS